MHVICHDEQFCNTVPLPSPPPPLPEPPSVPTGPVRFTDIQQTSLTLDWLPPKDDGGTPVTAYTVYMSVEDGEFQELGQIDARKTKMKINDLKTGAPYKFRICAVNKVGPSKPLESDTVVPKRQPGTVVVVVKSVAYS